MDSFWEYNAPQFVDFTKHIDDDGVDNYFDVDHEMLSEQSVNTTMQPVPTEVEMMDTNSESVVQHDRSVHSDYTGGEEPNTTAYEDAMTSLTSTQNNTTPMSNYQRKTRSALRTGADDVSGPIQSASRSQGRGKESFKIHQVRQTETQLTTGDLVVESSADTMPKYNTISLSEDSTPCYTKSRLRNSAHATNSTGKNICSDTVNSSMPRQRCGSLDRLNSSSNSSKKSAAGQLSRCQSQERQLNKTGKCQELKKLTIPQTPKFLKREMKFLHAAGKVESSEQLELNKIRQLRRELAEKRRLAEESRVKALNSNGFSGAVRSTQPLTNPEGFRFLTDDRLKSHGMETRLDSESLKEFAFESGLRHYQPVSAEHRGPTVPQPFRLHGDRKRKLSENDVNVSKFESVAEKVIKFCTRTPDRFRRKPSPDVEIPPVSKEADKLTVPKTPTLQTRGRSRPVHVISQSEREQLEIEEAKKLQFKANPVNTKILTNPVSGIKRVAPKECTVPEEFHLEIEERLKQRKVHNPEPVEEAHAFHANPLPKRILEGPTGINPPKQLPLTVPQSPAFSTRQRALAAAVIANVTEQVAEENITIKAHPVPHVGIPFQPRLEHHVTNVVPFSFEERNKEMMARKEEKIKQIYEEEKKAREFTARPIRNLTPVLPRKKVLPITKPEPFELEVDVRGAAKQQDKHRQLEEEEQKLKAMAVFKANPINVLLNKPFIPQPANKAPTETLPVQLSTELRAKSRHEWEKWKHEKEMESAMERIEREKQREREELEQLKTLRNEAVHKANPVRIYKPVVIVPSTQPLTLPESPRFSDRLRAKMLRH